MTCNRWVGSRVTRGLTPNWPETPTTEVRVQDRPATDKYRGRRRVPTLPGSRYALVVATALMCAGVVVVGAGTALPDHAEPLGLAPASVTADFADRVGGDDRASRSENRVAAREFNQPAPDVWLLPVKGYRVTSPFGPRWGTNHNGVDLAAREGTPFYAVANGVVAICAWNGGYGYNVQINHGGGVTTVYGHASQLKCRQGQRVRAGDLIALVGNTGNSYGAHLHFEVRQNDNAIEPVSFMRKHGVDITTGAQSIYGDKIGN